MCSVHATDVEKKYPTVCVCVMTGLKICTIIVYVLLVKKKIIVCDGGNRQTVTQTDVLFRVTEGRKASGQILPVSTVNEFVFGPRLRTHNSFNLSVFLTFYVVSFCFITFLSVYCRILLSFTTFFCKV